MEGLAAFGLVVNIIQLVDFTSKLVSGGHEIYKSTDGQLVEHTELQKTTGALSKLAGRVKDSVESLEQKRGLSQNEEDQARLGRDCVRLATEFLEALDSLKVGGKAGKWQSFRQALLTVWHKDKMESLEKRLDRFRQQLIADILGTLRFEMKAANEKQSHMADKVERIEFSTKTIGQSFLGYIDDSKRWRDDLIEAMHKNTLQS